MRESSGRGRSCQDYEKEVLLPDLLTAFAFVAVVLTVSALASGLVERAPLSFPIIFLGLGFLLGEKGLGFLTLGPEDTALESIAVLTLALVFFLDAVRLRESERSGAGLFGGAAQETPRIDPDELAEELEGPNAPIVLDVRTRSQYERDLTRIPGSVRVAPDAVEDWAARWISQHPDGEPHLRPIATYCT